MAVADFRDTIGKKIRSNLYITTVEKYPENPEYGDNVDQDYANAIGDAIEGFLERELSTVSTPLWDVVDPPIRVIEDYDDNGNHIIFTELHWEEYVNDSSDSTVRLEKWLLFRGVDSGTLVLHDSLPADMTSYIDDDVAYNTTYTYALIAVDTYGNFSPQSVEESIETPSAPISLTPEDQILTGIDVKSIKLKYDGVNMPNLSHYRIEYRRAPAEETVDSGYVVPSVPQWEGWILAGRINALSFTHEKLDSTYCYQYRYASVNKYNIISDYNSDSDISLLTDPLIPLAQSTINAEYEDTFLREIKKRLNTQTEDHRTEYFISYDSQNPQYTNDYGFGWTNDSIYNNQHDKDIWYQINNDTVHEFNGNSGLWNKLNNITEYTFYDNDILYPTELAITLQEWDKIIAEKVMISKTLNLLPTSTDIKSNYYVGFNRLQNYLYDSIDGKLLNLNKVTYAEYIAGSSAKTDNVIYIFMETGEPTANGVGDIWINTTDNSVSVWDGSYWNLETDSDIVNSIIEFKDDNTGDNRVLLHYLSTEPIATVNDYWTDINSNKLYKYDGTNWNEITDYNVVCDHSNFENIFNQYYYQRSGVFKALANYDYNYELVRFRNNDSLFNVSTDLIEGKYIYDYIIDYGNSIYFYSVDSVNLGSISSPSEGDIAYTTDTKEFYKYSSGAWVELVGDYDFLKAFYSEDGFRRLFSNRTEEDRPTAYETGDLLFPKFSFSYFDGTTQKEYIGKIIYEANTNSAAGFDNDYWQIAIHFSDSIARKLKINVYNYFPDGVDDDYFTGDIYIPPQQLNYDDGISIVTYEKDAVYVATIPDEDTHAANNCPMINSYWTQITLFTSELFYQGADDTLTPTEKKAIYNEWQTITEEFNAIVDEAENYLIETIEYEQAYYRLETYLFNNERGVLNDLNTNSSIDGQEFESKFEDYYITKEELQKKISLSAKIVAPSEDFQIHLSFDDVDSSQTLSTIDGTGNGFDADLYGSFDSVLGISGRAIEFTPEQDGYGVITTGSNLTFSNKLTITGWFKASTYKSGQGNGILIGSNFGVSEGFKLAFATDNNLSFITYHGTEERSTIIENFNSGQWFFITAIFESGIKTIYINTVKISEEIILPTTIDSLNSPLYINGNYNGRFEGTVDEFRIYNRVISEDEMRYLYRSPSDGTNVNLSVAKTLKGLNVDGEIINIIKGPNLPSITPDVSGLYTTNDYIGFFDAEETDPAISPWKAYIHKSGDFQFWGDEHNYLAWNGTALQVEGTIAGGAVYHDQIYNYWDLITGDFRIGDNKNFIYFDANSGSLSMQLNALYVETLKSNIKGVLHISNRQDITPKEVDTANPLILGTEKTINTDPTYGFISHDINLRIRVGGNDRLTINEKGDTEIDGKLKVGKRLSADGREDFVDSSYLNREALNFPHYAQSYWPFAEGTGTVLTDIKGGNNGSINGATWALDGTMRYLDFAVGNLVSITEVVFTGDFTISLQTKPATGTDTSMLNNTTSTDYSFSYRFL